MKIIPLDDGSKTFTSGSSNLKRPFVNNELADGSITTWLISSRQVVELKQQAIATYCSQTTNLIDDDLEGFRLTPQMLANFTRLWEVYLEENEP